MKNTKNIKITGLTIYVRPVFCEEYEERFIYHLR